MPRSCLLGPPSPPPPVPLALASRSPSVPDKKQPFLAINQDGDTHRNADPAQGKPTLVIVKFKKCGSLSKDNAPVFVVATGKCLARQIQGEKRPLTPTQVTAKYQSKGPDKSSLPFRIISLTSRRGHFGRNNDAWRRRRRRPIQPSLHGRSPRLEAQPARARHHCYGTGESLALTRAMAHLWHQEASLA